MTDGPDGANGPVYAGQACGAGAGWQIAVRLDPGAGTAELFLAADYAQLIGH